MTQIFVILYKANEFFDFFLTCFSFVAHDFFYEVSHSLMEVWNLKNGAFLFTSHRFMFTFYLSSACQAFLCICRNSCLVFYINSLMKSLCCLSKRKIKERFKKKLISNFFGQVAAEIFNKSK